MSYDLLLECIKDFVDKINRISPKIELQRAWIALRNFDGDFQKLDIQETNRPSIISLLGNQEVRRKTRNSLSMMSSSDDAQRLLEALQASCANIDSFTNLEGESEEKDLVVLKVAKKARENFKVKSDVEQLIEFFESSDLTPIEFAQENQDMIDRLDHRIFGRNRSADASPTEVPSAQNQANWASFGLTRDQLSQKVVQQSENAGDQFPNGRERVGQEGHPSSPKFADEKFNPFAAPIEDIPQRVDAPEELSANQLQTGLRKNPKASILDLLAGAEVINSQLPPPNEGQTAEKNLLRKINNGESTMEQQSAPQKEAIRDDKVRPRGQTHTAGKELNRSVIIAKNRMTVSLNRSMNLDSRNFEDDPIMAEKQTALAGLLTKRLTRSFQKADQAISNEKAIKNLAEVFRKLRKTRFGQAMLLLKDAAVAKYFPETSAVDPQEAQTPTKKSFEEESETPFQADSPRPVLRIPPKEVAALPEIPQPKQIASNEFENIRAPVSPTLAKNMAWDEEGSRKLAKTDKLSSELSFTDFQKRRRMSPSPVRKLERDGPNTPRPTHSPQNDRLDTSERTEQLSKLEMFKKKSEEVDQLIPKSKRVTLQYSSPAAFDQKITPNYPKSDRHCVLPVNLEESSELSASINHAEIDQVLSKILTDLKSSEDFDHVGNNQILEGLQEEGIEAGNLKNAVAEIYHQNDFFAKNLGPQDEIGYLELAKSIQIIEKGHCKKVLSESFAELIINKNQAALTAKVVRLMDHLIHKSSDQMKSALQALKKVPSKTILSKLDQARAALGLPPSLKDQGVGTPRYQSLVNANLSPQKLDAYTSQLIVAHTAKVRELQVKGR